MRRIDRSVRTPLDIHLVLDNYGTHKTPEVKAWLAKHPRLHLHFTPTSASWLNLVERFFAEITIKRIRRGAFASVAELEQAICDYLKEHNTDPNPSSGRNRPRPSLRRSGAPFSSWPSNTMGTNRQSRNTRQFCFRLEPI